MRNSRSRLATWMEVTLDAAPTTPDITFRTCVLLQWYSPPSMLLIEPDSLFVVHQTGALFRSFQAEGERADGGLIVRQFQHGVNAALLSVIVGGGSSNIYIYCVCAYKFIGELCVRRCLLNLLCNENNQ